MDIEPTLAFLKATKHLDPFLKTKVLKVISKIEMSLDIGKPLKYTQNERAVSVLIFGLIYTYRENTDTLYLLKFDHRSSV